MRCEVLKVVGAGLGRTGTRSLQHALAQLLDEPCYHMAEVIQHPEHVPLWDVAYDGNLPDWDALFAGYAAVVDWPAVSFWEEIAEAYPDAIILMSYRSAESWWDSASQTIFEITKRIEGPWRVMVEKMFGQFAPERDNRDACIAAFNAHYARVRERAPASRLVEWQQGDGWGPSVQRWNCPYRVSRFRSSTPKKSTLRTSGAWMRRAKGNSGCRSRERCGNL